MATLLVGALLSACGADTEEEAPGEGGGQGQPVAVELAEVRVETLEETVRGIGSARALEEVILRPETSGILREIDFAEGERVEEGQVLFRLDHAVLEGQRRAALASLRSARAHLDNAERRFERQAALLERNVAAQSTYDEALAGREAAEAEVERLRAEVALAEERIDDTRVTAPFDGVISERLVDRGAWVQAGQDLAALYRTDGLEVSFRIPERYADRVKAGQTVRVAVGSRPDERIDGEVTYISPTVDEANRDLQFKARLRDPPALEPGSFVTAHLVLDVRRDRPVVPEAALVGTREGYVVFVVNDGIAERRAVEIGLRQPGTVEIRRGVEAGERVVREGHMRLGDGSPVRERRAGAGGAGSGGEDGAGPGSDAAQ